MLMIYPYPSKTEGSDAKQVHTFSLSCTVFIKAS